MQIFNTPDRFGVVAQALHWATAVLVAFSWMLGQAGDDVAAILSAHMFAGLAVFVVLALRLIWRLVDPPPTPEATGLGAWADRAARIVHYVLLALLVLAPAVGIAYQFARGEALPLFGFAEISSPIVVSREAARSVKEAHEFFANALLMVALLHAAAALFHHWVLRDRVLKRMWPFGVPR